MRGRWPPLAKDVQVDGGGFAQGVEDSVDLLDAEPLLRLTLPAPEHDIVHLFGTDPGPLQDAALGDALDDLGKGGESRCHTGARSSARPPEEAPTPPRAWHPQARGQAGLQTVRVGYEDSDQPWLAAPCVPYLCTPPVYPTSPGTPMMLLLRLHASSPGPKLTWMPELHSFSTWEWDWPLPCPPPPHEAA